MGQFEPYLFANLASYFFASFAVKGFNRKGRKVLREGSQRKKQTDPLPNVPQQFITMAHFAKLLFLRISMKN